MLSISQHTLIPFHVNPIFIHYGTKATITQTAILILQNIIAEEAFEKDPQTYFEKWKAENPVGLQYDEARDCYYSNYAVPLVIKNILSFIKENKNIVSILKAKLAIQEEANFLLNQMKKEIEIKFPREESPNVLIEHVKKLEEKDQKSAAEIKVLKTIKKITNQINPLNN